MADLTAGGVPVYRDSAGVLREAPSDAKMQAMEQALAAKADKTALASKADATALATKTDASALAAKADASAVTALASAMPQPATSAPPAVQVDSAKGADSRYALADHTHESRLQARRVQLTFDANGEAIYTFPKPYDAGVVPIVQATAENVRGAAFRYDATVRQGSATNLATTIILTKTPRTLTVSLLGAVLNLFTNPAETAWVNIMSRAPS